MYDLTVDGAHEFYANGILVHNSLDSLRYIAMSRPQTPQEKEQEEGGTREAAARTMVDRMTKGVRDDAKMYVG